MGKGAIKAERRQQRSEEGKDGPEGAKSGCREEDLLVFPSSSSAYSVICRPVCGIHMMSCLAAAFGIVLMMFCNQVL